MFLYGSCKPSDSLFFGMHKVWTTSKVLFFNASIGLFMSCCMHAPAVHSLSCAVTTAVSTLPHRNPFHSLSWKSRANLTSYNKSVSHCKTCGPWRRQCPTGASYQSAPTTQVIVYYHKNRHPNNVWQHSLIVTSAGAGFQ